MSLTQCQTGRRHFCVYMEFLLLPTPGPDCRTTLPLHLPPPIRHHSQGLGKLTCLNNIKTILFPIISSMICTGWFFIFLFIKSGRYSQSNFATYLIQLNAKIYINCCIAQHPAHYWAYACKTPKNTWPLLYLYTYCMYMLQYRNTPLFSPNRHFLPSLHNSCYNMP